MQECQRLAHFIHAIHAVLNADVTAVADITQDLKNRIVVVHAFAGHAMLQGR